MEADWTAAAALIGMSVVLVCTTAVCVLAAVWANVRADEIRAQRDTVTMRAQTALREVEVLKATVLKKRSDGMRRVDRWRSDCLDAREKLAMACQLFGWHADLPPTPIDTVMDDLSDTIPREQQA